MLNSLDKLMATGSKNAFPKDAQPGATVTGIITDATERQVTDFETKKPQFWDDGQPKKQVVITIQTQERLDAEDDGVRSVYIKGWGAQKQALASAIRDAGFTLASQALAAGNVFTARFTGLGENPRGGFPPKLYSYQVQRGAQVTTFDAPAQQQPVVQQPVGDPWGAPTPAPTPATPAAAVPAAPTPVEATTGAENPALTLLRAGVDEETIIAQTGLTPDVIAILRQQL